MDPVTGHGGVPDGPAYRRDAIGPGPFDTEPLQLWRLVGHRRDGSMRPGEEIVACSTGWMVGALDTAGVELGEHDRQVAALLAADGWSIVQVVAGWVARARAAGERHRTQRP